MSINVKVKNAFDRNPVFWSFVIGAVIGYLILRPYTVFVYILFNYMETGEIGLHSQIYIEGPRAFKFFMLLTSVSFVIFGGLSGFIFGKWYDRKQTHIQEQIEHEKKGAALETLKELNVTLSHYILNSSAIIKGFAQRGNRRADNEKMREYFSIIEEEVDKTIAVMKGLEVLKEIESVKYVESGTEMMIDLKRQINEQLEKLKNIKETEIYEREKEEQK
jgi:signal transduction histidine kinase